jgi:hypothetical protein
MPEYVSLKTLAYELGLDRSNMRKYVLKHGFALLSVRTPDSRHQLTLALTVEDAEILRELRNSQGFGVNPTPTDNGKGYLYVIQLIPELAPNRVKLGFATDAIARLSAHQTASPTAKLVKSWPCKRSWEGTVIESATRVGCTHIANEVFECDDLFALVERCNALFSIMPSVSG